MKKINKKDKQRIIKSGLFDPEWYSKKYPDVGISGIDPLEHYFKIGIHLRRQAHPLFDAAWYLAENPDIAEAGCEPLGHYLTCGWKEGRNPHPLFDTAWYLAENADVVEAGCEPLGHYLSYGWKEGRNPHPLFDAVWYLAENHDIAEAGCEPLSHYLSYGWKEGRNLHPLFDTAWYLAENPDIAEAVCEPLGHYLSYGWKEGRDPSPEFNGEKYLAHNQDVKGSGKNPLIEYICYGKYDDRTYKIQLENTASDVRYQTRSVNRIKTAISVDEALTLIQRILSIKQESKAQKLLPDFNSNIEGDYLNAAFTIYDNDLKHYEKVKVSVIMPTYNRADKISHAIKSVLAQSHENFELLIIDDGSSDNTKCVLKSFACDARIRPFSNNHSGVCAARNTGLKNATGSLIFYLDSDNVWTPDFLVAMIVAFNISENDCVYGASELTDANKKIIGYRGEPFDWEQCLEGNYIDMNVFAHRVEMITKHGCFDATLERMVDWDLILRYTRENGALYCPVLGCIYFDDSMDVRRITSSKPYIYRKLVQEKNKFSLKSTAETFDRISLKIALKIAAPYKVRHAWGDFHYAESLKIALERLGHEVRIDFLEDWEKHPVNSSDVTLVLRGLSSYEPKSSEFSILWNISHPDQISYEEYAGYKLIFAASASYAELLSKILERPVYPLMQCTDSERFGFRGHQNTLDVPGVFVGNSRNQYREIVRWSIESGLDLDIYGQRWENFVPTEMVKQDNVPNNELADLYAGGRFVLNDHWASMRDFGIISNRIFDVVGCGGRLVSDYIPSVEDLFDGVVEMVNSQDELKATLDNKLSPISRKQRQAASEIVHARHSFDARAAQIVDHIRALLFPSDNNKSTATRTAAMVTRVQRKRVGLFLQQGRAWPTSSAFIRLIGPLTTDYACNSLELVYLDNVDDVRLDDCAVCIVQRVAVREDAAASNLLTRLGELGIPLYVDTDDAFFLHDQHKDDDVVLQKLMAAAKEAWFSTPVLEELYRGVPGVKRVLCNNLDPRFWRDYRTSVSTSFDAPKVRFVYMGTATHDSDFMEVLPAFEKLARDMPDTFELTLVGAVRSPPTHRWLKILPPPAENGSYPKFVRWLVRHAQFDVGIAPLADSAFNHAKSDIKILDYGALGLLPLVSECPAYAEAIAAGLAVGCKSSVTDWYTKATDIIRNPSTYEPMRTRALENVWEKRNTLNTSPNIADLIIDRWSQLPNALSLRQ